MHDQKKKEKEVLSPEERAAAATEHERVGTLYKAVLHVSKTHAYSTQTLEDTEKLLLAVPEAYTAYNCRRRALETIWKETGTHHPKDEYKDAAAGAPDATDTQTSSLTQQEWLRKELKLNSTVLLMNYKNYNAFVHRHWVFDQLEALAKAELIQHAQQTTSPFAAPAAAETGSTATTSSASTAAAVAPTLPLVQQLLQRERAQCEQLLQMDERNFHAWNYRRWVLAQECRAGELERKYLPAVSGVDAGAQAGDRSSTSSLPHATSFTKDEAFELAYTTQKIKNNFSNYSAWHQRSLALKSAAARWQQHLTVVDESTSHTAAAQRRECHGVLLKQLREDVDFLSQAIYCDPNDQSAWFYAPFALQLLQAVRQSATTEEDDGGAEAVALTESLVRAVMDLVAEVDAVGRGEECYMPYYFLLDRLLTLQSAQQEADGQAAVARYTDALCAKVASLASLPGDAVQRRQGCVRFLHERLCAADGLRKGLYDDMVRKAAEAVV